ncbi:hypothetical protein WR25_24575 [Diploscapter pachys]|uniref:CC domain-containing protein n=1 Tax=Diploscapter pachys TaxID=2018661 RepID=A0A2A2LZ58_9BILA|nr:hypothetical protein WR25_24575 [Diploscapter pachys]
MKRFLFSVLLIMPIACFWVLYAQESPDSPEGPELRDANLTVSRQKRQYGCPSNCFSSCNNNQQCSMYSVQSVCIQGCCCPSSSSSSLNTACSGGPAVAACLNGLCGQGYFCSNNNFCCRCQTGNTTGPCVNNICPTGYTCGAGNLCYVTQAGK